MSCFNSHIYTNADAIGDNAEVKGGLEQHAVLLVARVSSQTHTTHNVFLAPEEAPVPRQSLPPPVRQARQLGQARRLLHQPLLRGHRLRLDQEPLLTRAIHFLESTPGLIASMPRK